jgi:hypothetical protein
MLVSSISVCVSASVHAWVVYELFKYVYVLVLIYIIRKRILCIGMILNFFFLISKKYIKEVDMIGIELLKKKI